MRHHHRLSWARMIINQTKDSADQNQLKTSKIIIIPNGSTKRASKYIGTKKRRRGTNENIKT